MPRTYDGRAMLINAIYDANRYISSDESEKACKMLENKIKEIRKIEKAEYFNITWDLKHKNKNIKGDDNDE